MAIHAGIFSVKMRSRQIRPNFSWPSQSERAEQQQEWKIFFPSGAIFFFAFLILFYAALWLVIRPAAQLPNATLNYLRAISAKQNAKDGERPFRLPANFVAKRRHL
jgi:hypothetical protein